MTLLQLVASLVVVTAGAEALVRGASALALRFGVSPLFVGLTIVGFGTSSPELAASVAATLGGATEVSVGNVVGSNIFNLAVIVGVAALIAPIHVELGALRRDLGVAVAAALVPAVALLQGGRLGGAAGAVLLGVLVVYLAVAYRSARHAGVDERDLARAEVEDTIARPPRRRLLSSAWAAGVLVAAGLACLVVGARFFVEAAIDLARTIGWSERLIGLTVVAAGTSLPELATSVVAGIRRNADIALGNVIGSNIFNSFGILGVSAMFGPQVVSPVVLAVDMPVMIVATLAMLPIMKTGGRISRLEGAFLLGGYAVYLAYLLVAG